VISPGFIVKAKDQSSEVLILNLRHFAIMFCLLVEFSASGGKFTVVNCGQDGGNQKGLGAKDTFGFKLVVFVANDLANSTRDNTFCGACGCHPSVKGEAGNIGGGRSIEGRWAWVF
jgi:hypothetical protein